MDDQFKNLNRLFTRIYSPNAGERAAAANLLYAAMESARIHVADVRLTPVGQSVHDLYGQSTAILTTELERLAAQLAFARRHLDDATIRTMDKVGSVVNRWCEVEPLLKAAFTVDGVLPRDWKRRLAEVTGQSPLIVDRWQDGLIPIPDSVLTQLNIHQERTKGWRDLERIARERWKTAKTPWRPLLTKLVGVTEAEVARWESGATAVPETVFVALRKRQAKKAPPQPVVTVVNGEDVVLPKLNVIHMAILEAIAINNGRTSYHTVATNVEKRLGIIPAEKITKESTWRHPIQARLPELNTGRKFGQPLIVTHKKNKVREFSMTEFGQKTYYHNLEHGFGGSDSVT